MYKIKTSAEKEWRKLQKQEVDFLVKSVRREDSKLNRLLEEKVPEGLQDTLDKAFYKAFQLIFEKGTGIIEKTYDREQLELDHMADEYVANFSGSRKALKAFSTKAKTSGSINTLVSGASGIGLGVLGIGIPDIVLFTGMMLRNIYQISLNYGFDYESDEEKKFILLIIRGALISGPEVKAVNNEADHYMGNGSFTCDSDLKSMIKEAAGCLSKELLYMKFLQGIPVVGALGGAYDAVYMKRVSKYAELKYRKRFLKNFLTLSD